MLGEDDKWFRVSLRIFGDTLDPTTVENLLGLPAENVGIKGQPRLGKNGRKYSLYETNLWTHSSPLSSDVCFEEQMQGILDALGTRVARLKELLEEEGIDGEFFCGFGSGGGQGGDSISAATLARLADAGLSLTLDLYPPTVDEDSPDDQAR